METLVKSYFPKALFGSLKERGKENFGGLEIQGKMVKYRGK